MPNSLEYQNMHSFCFVPTYSWKREKKRKSQPDSTVTFEHHDDVQRPQFEWNFMGSSWERFLENGISREPCKGLGIGSPLPFQPKTVLQPFCFISRISCHCTTNQFIGGVFTLCSKTNEPPSPSKLIGREQNFGPKEFTTRVQVQGMKRKSEMLLVWYHFLARP